jgi:hypothetical protein
MTPLASVAMQEKLALLKIAFCSAVESRSAAAARASRRRRSDVGGGCRRAKIDRTDQVLFFICAPCVRQASPESPDRSPMVWGRLEVRGWWSDPAECSLMNICNVTLPGLVSYYRCSLAVELTATSKAGAGRRSSPSDGRCVSCGNMHFRRTTLLGDDMRKTLIAMAAVALLGCGGDSTGPAVSAVGTWNLQTVDTKQLPYTAVFVASPLYKLEILSDVFVARADGSYTETFTERETDGTTVTTTSNDDTGTWVQHNASLTITSSDQTTTNATISGKTITINAQGLVLVYEKQ